MPKQIPCLWMDGTAEQAAQHYTSIFPNSSIGAVTRYGPDMPPPMQEGDVLTVTFTLDGQEYTALNGGPQFPHSEAISFQIMCRDQEEADHYWNRLAEGGEESQCGWLKDRFGVSWQVIADRDDVACSTTPTPAARSAPPRRCCRCAGSTSPRSGGRPTASTPEPSVGSGPH